MARLVLQSEHGFMAPRLPHHWDAVTRRSRCNAVGAAFLGLDDCQMVATNTFLFNDFNNRSCFSIPSHFSTRVSFVTPRLSIGNIASELCSPGETIRLGPHCEPLLVDLEAQHGLQLGLATLIGVGTLLCVTRSLQMMCGAQHYRTSSDGMSERELDDETDYSDTERMLTWGGSFWGTLEFLLWASLPVFQTAYDEVLHPRWCWAENWRREPHVK